MMNKHKTEIPARTACIRIIAHWMDTGDFPERMLPQNSPQRALIQEIVYGVCRRKRSLEAILSKLVPREPDTLTKATLLTGMYQIFMMDNIPPHAITNETVEAAKLDLDQPRIRFVNGVLRNSLRRKQELFQWLQNQPLPVQTSHPNELVERWTYEYGAETAEAICKWNNQRPTVALRINRQLTTPADLLRQLKADGIAAAPHPADPERFLSLPPGINISALPGYKEGYFTIQDPATMLAVDMLQISPAGHKLLDACAAPGGKTFACAEQMANKGMIVAADLHADRLAQLRENAERLNFSCIRIQQADASKMDTIASIKKLAPFDRILLDVPCSNTGVLRRRPDARWRFNRQRLRKLTTLQTRILNSCSRLLAPGGIMVYSTCSLEPDENEKIVERWTARHPDFRIDAMQNSIPPDSGMDGAFCARITRKPHPH